MGSELPTGASPEIAAELRQHLNELYIKAIRKKVSKQVALLTLSYVVASFFGLLFVLTLLTRSSGSGASILFISVSAIIGILSAFAYSKEVSAQLEMDRVALKIAESGFMDLMLKELNAPKSVTMKDKGK